MSSLSRAQSWPLLSGAAPVEEARQAATRTSQVGFVGRNYGHRIAPISYLLGIKSVIDMFVYLWKVDFENKMHVDSGNTDANARK
jgi:hypothetical protein